MGPHKIDPVKIKMSMLSKRLRPCRIIGWKKTNKTHRRLPIPFLKKNIRIYIYIDKQYHH